MLEDACRECDIIAKLEAAMASAPLLVKGTQGQPAISSFVSELRQHRSVLSALLRNLRLPEAEADSGQAERRREAASDLARRAARARWDRRGYGTGA
jgi:hypothetical protein